MTITATESALLSALWKALEAQDVSFDDGENTWIDGHFEKGQLAFNMLASLAEDGMVLVPRAGYAVIVSNNDGGDVALLPSLDAVRAWIKGQFADCDPPMSEWGESNRTAALSDVAALGGVYVESVRGPDAWNETIYVAPLKDATIESATSQGEGEWVTVPKAEYERLLEVEEMYDNACSAAEDHRWD